MTASIQHVAEANHNVVEAADSIQTATRETTKAAKSIAGSAQGLATTAEKLQGFVGLFTDNYEKTNPNGLNRVPAARGDLRPVGRLYAVRGLQGSMQVQE